MIESKTTISDYRKVRMGRKKIRVLEDFIRYGSEVLPRDRFFDGLRGPFVRVSSSSTARVFKCRINFHSRCLNLYLKQHLYRSPLDYLKHLVRPSRAMREFKASLMLAKNGIRTPPIIATGRIPVGLFHARNFLITANLENAQSLYLWLCRNMPPGNADTLRSRRLLIRQLGETVGRMHAAGICHGDLRPGNIFIESVSGQWRFFLLDNERTAKFLRMPRRKVVKNLVQVGMLHDQYLTRTDRLRFLKCYLRQNPRLKKDYKALATKVFEKTQSRLQGKKPAEILGRPA